MNLNFYNLIHTKEKRFLNSDELNEFFSKCNLNKDFFCSNSTAIRFINEDYIDDGHLFGIIYKNELIKNDLLHDISVQGLKIDEVNIKNSTFFIINDKGEFCIIESNKTPRFKSAFDFLLKQIFNLSYIGIGIYPSKEELSDVLNTITRLYIYTGEKCNKNSKLLREHEDFYKISNGAINELKISILFEKNNNKNFKDDIINFLNLKSSFLRKATLIGESEDGDVLVDYLSKKITVKKEIKIDHLFEENIENIKEKIYQEIRNNMYTY